MKIRIVIYTEKSETNPIIRDNGTETTSIENVLHRDCRYVILSYWTVRRNGKWKGQGEQTWIPNFEEVNMKNYGYFQLVSFLDMYNYNYLKRRSHWEHTNIRSMHLQKFWVVYWQPLLIWNVARRNTLFWISGHWNIFKRLLSKEQLREQL